jgi:hypothetical protein
VDGYSSNEAILNETNNWSIVLGWIGAVFFYKWHIAKDPLDPIS